MPGHLLVVGELGAHPLGFLHAYARPALEKPPEAVVQALVVDRTRRRTGIGRRLMAAAKRWAAGQGFASIVFASQLHRDEDRAFYGSLGYDPIATSQVMRKKIGPHR